MNGQTSDTIKEQQHQIDELKERILMERLDSLRNSIHRVEEISKKTYEQAMVTNGRVTKLEDANLIDRIRHVENQIIPVSVLFKYKKTILITLFVLYIIAISPLGTTLYDAILNLLPFVK